ncbi:MAG: GntR family transcriptional regulator [Lachnospiraceae bacterium]|nr:GntR family transcriptional regulator [Lachnospiraceae bacterium]
MTEFQYKNSKGESFMPLRDVVYLKLRESILKEELPPGTRLMEVHLAEKLGVSRTPVREAIHMLATEGLVIFRPGRGAKVAKLTQKDMDDVLQIRSALEALAVRLSCDHRSTTDLDNMRKAMMTFEKAVNDGKDLKTLSELD